MYFKDVFFDEPIVTGKSKQILNESLTILKAGSEKEMWEAGNRPT